MRVLSYEGFRDALAQIITGAHRAPTVYFELERLAAEAKRDGYPGSSGLEYSAPTSELDDDGTPLPQHSDRTAQVVLQRERLDEACVKVTGQLSEARRCFERLFAIAEEHGVRLDAETGELLPPVDAADAPKPPDPGEVWCRHHLSFGMYQPRGGKGRRGLCSTCDVYDRSKEPHVVALKELAGSSLPPRELLDRAASTDRLSSRDYSEVTSLYRRRMDAERGRHRKVKR